MTQKHRSQIIVTVAVHMHACSRASERRRALIFGLLTPMLLRVMIHHKMALNPACDACISEADCDSVSAFSTASDPAAHVAFGVLFPVIYASESILNMTYVLTQQYKTAFQGSLLASRSYIYNAQDSALVQCSRLRQHH